MFKVEIVFLALSCFSCTVYKQKIVHYWKPFFVANRVGEKSLCKNAK